jgi:hypothetical protein
MTALHLNLAIYFFLLLLLLQAMLDGKERTTQQWQQLFGVAGFTIKSINQGPAMAAIAAVPCGPN